jgi:hypothetical protein
MSKVIYITNTSLDGDVEGENAAGRVSVDAAWESVYLTNPSGDVTDHAEA